MADIVVYIPRTLRVDLRPFGFGIRDVTVLSGSGMQPAPNSVGTDEIQDGAVELQDINQQAFAGDSDIDDIFNGDAQGG